MGIFSWLTRKRDININIHVSGTIKVERAGDQTDRNVSDNQQSIVNKRESEQIVDIGDIKLPVTDFGTEVK